MNKSGFAVATDQIQTALRVFMKGHNFRCKGRTFNRVTPDGLTQVVGIQMGPADPPGTTYIPGLREDLHGLFTINLGVHVPEVARYTQGGNRRSWIQPHDCCVRARLGEAAGSAQDIWWHARFAPSVVDDVTGTLNSAGIPFLERFGSRNKILAEWHGRSENMGASQPSRIVLAIILAERGEKSGARKLLAGQAHETRNPGHPAYVRTLAKTLGLGDLDI